MSSILPAGTPPRRITLVEQTASVMKENISKGHWKDFLPPENVLAKDLGISRITLRKAIAELCQQGWMTTGGRGYRNQIVWPGEAAETEKQVSAVHLLSPVPDHQLVPSTRILVNEIRTNLTALGWSLEFDCRKSLWQGRVTPKLRKLTQSSPGTTWLLYRANAAIQHWFQENQLPCVLLGPRHEGVILPNVEYDVRALARHAGAEMARCGHRRVAFIVFDPEVASALRTTAGLQAQLEPYGKLTHLSVVKDDYTLAGLRGELTTLMQGPTAPTCMLASEADQAWPIISLLKEMNLRVPEDVSLIVRDHEPFLDRCVPAITRYSFDAPRFGRLVTSLLREVVEGHVSHKIHRTLLPTFVPGATLAPCRE